MSRPRVLTVAGSDSGGGAGIQADLKTFFRFGTYGMTAVTALTAQNTVGVQGIFPASADFVAAQMDSVACDIGVDAVKTGMLADQAILEKVADRVANWALRPLVVDPVMVAKSGDQLLEKGAIDQLIDKILPLTDVFTPNVPEAEILLARRIRDQSEQEEAAKALQRLGCRVVVLKGGHLPGDVCTDVFRDAERMHVLSTPRIQTAHTHGTGCTFAAAIAAGLAQGWDALAAVTIAKQYVDRAIKDRFSLGSGRGPINHWASPTAGVEGDGRR